MIDVSDIEPQVQEAVLAHADEYLEAQRRVQEVVGGAEVKLREAENALQKQVRAGVSEETALDEYAQTCSRVRAQLKEALASLEREYQEKFPPQTGE